MIIIILLAIDFLTRINQIYLLLQSIQKVYNNLAKSETCKKSGLYSDDEMYKNL